VGIVETMNGDSWTIGDRVALITSKTEIDPDITLEDDVEVEGILEEDGSVTVQEIKLLGAN
jgi:hypothetical protein